MSDISAVVKTSYIGGNDNDFVLHQHTVVGFI
jgi:hypothetical protein